MDKAIFSAGFIRKKKKNESQKREKNCTFDHEK